MKRLLLVLTVVLTAGIANAQIIIDGGFEDGASGAAWSQASTNFGTPICDGGCGNCGGNCGANTGSFYVWIGGAGG